MIGRQNSQICLSNQITVLIGISGFEKGGMTCIYCERVGFLEWGDIKYLGLDKRDTESSLPCKSMNLDHPGSHSMSSGQSSFLLLQFKGLKKKH